MSQFKKGFLEPSDTEFAVGFGSCVGDIGLALATTLSNVGPNGTYGDRAGLDGRFGYLSRGIESESSICPEWPWEVPE
jgi:hypothetical protein